MKRHPDMTKDGFIPLHWLCQEHGLTSGTTNYVRVYGCPAETRLENGRKTYVTRRADFLAWLPTFRDRAARAKERSADRMRQIASQRTIAGLARQQARDREQQEHYASRHHAHGEAKRPPSVVLALLADVLGPDMVEWECDVDTDLRRCGGVVL